MGAFDTTREVRFPDEVAADKLSHLPPYTHYPRFSMCAGDFTQIYRGEEHVGAWDAVITCFFIDTAPVVIEYIEVIERILKPGGVWINMGPLLYHWSKEEQVDEGNDPRYDMSIEVRLPRHFTNLSLQWFCVFWSKWNV